MSKTELAEDIAALACKIGNASHRSGSPLGPLSL